MEVDVIMEKADGTVTTTAVTPTETGTGVYDWVHANQGYYTLELPASGGGDYNNTEEGVLTVVVFVTGVVPMRSASYDVISVQAYNSLVTGSDKLEVDAVEASGSAATMNQLEAMLTGGGGHDGTNVTLTLGHVYVDSGTAAGGVRIVNDNGSALVAGGTTHGLEVNASAGPGIEVDGTTFGIQVDASAGPGLHIGGTTYGMRIASSTGRGVAITAATAGVDIAGTAHGLDITASAGPGVEIDGTTFGVEIDASAGPGMHIGGTTIGLDIDASAGPGMDIDGTAYAMDLTASAGTGMRVVGSVADIVADITGNLSGSVGSLTANNDKTGYGLADSAITAAKFAADAIAAAAIATNAFTADAFAGACLTEANIVIDNTEAANAADVTSSFWEMAKAYYRSGIGCNKIDHSNARGTMQVWNDAADAVLLEYTVDETAGVQRRDVVADP